MAEEPKEEWTNIQFDSQIFNTFMGCPREMKLRFMEHLVPKHGVSQNILKGSLIHDGMQAYYEGMKEGTPFTYNKTLGLRAMQVKAPTLGLDSDNILDCYRNFEEYLEYRKNDVFQVVFTEQVFRFIVYESYPIRVILTGRIDMGVLETNSTQIIPWDHKSESEYWFYSTLTNQFMIYALATKAQRLVVNRFGFQKTVKPEKRFHREELNFDVDTLDEFKNETLPYYAKQMIVAHSEGYFPPNYTHCIKGHWGCPFSDRYEGGICNVSPKVREQKIKMFFYQKEWNPEN